MAGYRRGPLRNEWLEDIVEAVRRRRNTLKRGIAFAAVVIHLEDFEEAGVLDDELDGLGRSFGGFYGGAQNVCRVFAAVNRDDLHAGAEAGLVGDSADFHVVDDALPAH